MSKHRTKDNYAIALDIIETSQKVDSKDTKGIARYCSLNDLDFFHIYDNFNVDIMHDICEGVIPVLFNNLFQYFLREHLFSSIEEFNNVIFFHDYGVLHSHRIPSTISLTKPNLGQNASQNKCLLHHLPYIMHEFKFDPRLIRVWTCVVSLLKILRIIYSANVTENDLLELESTVSTYLRKIRECFDIKNMTFKHHMLIHYANVIRAVGPLVHMSTMRFEMTHKFYTNYARRSNNYINVTKSLAVNNQKAALSNNPYQCQISHAKLRDFHGSIKSDTRILNDSEKILVTKWLKINDSFYRKGLLLKDNNNSFYEIDEVLCQNGKFYFACEEYELMQFDAFLYSREIQKRVPTKYHILEEKSLCVRKTFMRKTVDAKSFIMADCLDVPVE